MKARVKATGEIVDAVMTQRVTHTGELVYMTNDGYLIEESRLDFNVDDTPDYWTRLEHQYAGMVMHSILQTMPGVSDPDKYMKAAIDLSAKIATALVEKLKEKEK